MSLMDSAYRSELLRRTGEVFASHPESYDHRRDFPWLLGALGDPCSGIWFVGENPSLGQVERVRDPQGGPPTEEAQWWASRGDRLFRELLVKHGFKKSSTDAHGGWNCYITNVIKEADYAQVWRGSSAERRTDAARAWAPLLKWELEESRPVLVVSLGKTVRAVLDQLRRQGLRFPRIETVQHYSYVALRPRGKQGPMHPERVREYDEEFASIAALFKSLKPNAT
jgi:hypothetical protein